ncbi:MAG: hypothetical protein R3357_12825 [Burkholderiales bacterium]|nr:hypothetical protein [Burkholderiales bacterium]
MFFFMRAYFFSHAFDSPMCHRASNICASFPRHRDGSIGAHVQRSKLTLSALLDARCTTGSAGAAIRVDRVRPVGFGGLAAESRRLATAYERREIRRADRPTPSLSDVSACPSCFFP